MTDEEIEAAYEALKKRREEEERISWNKTAYDYAKSIVGQPITFETKLHDNSFNDYPPNDLRDRWSSELDEALDKLTPGCKIKVTIEVLEP